MASLAISHCSQTKRYRELWALFHELRPTRGKAPRWLIDHFLDMIEVANYHPDLTMTVAWAVDLASGFWILHFPTIDPERCRDGLAVSDRMDHLLEQYCCEGLIDWMDAWRLNDRRCEPNPTTRLLQIAIDHDQRSTVGWVMASRMQWIDRMCVAPKRSRKVMKAQIRQILTTSLARADLSVEMLACVMKQLKLIPNIQVLHAIGLRQLTRISNWDVHPRILMRATHEQLQAIAIQKQHIGQSQIELWIAIIRNSKGGLTQAKVRELMVYFPVDDPAEMIMKVWSDQSVMDLALSLPFIVETGLDLSVGHDHLIRLLITNRSRLDWSNNLSYRRHTGKMLDQILIRYPIDLERKSDNLLLLSRRLSWPILHQHTLGSEIVLWFHEDKMCVCSRHRLERHQEYGWLTPTMLLHLVFDQDRELFIYTSIDIRAVFNLDRSQHNPCDQMFSVQVTRLKNPPGNIHQLPVSAIKKGPVLDAIKHALRKAKRAQ